MRRARKEARPEVCVGGGDFDFGTVGRRQRRKNAKFGGFNAGRRGKARRNVSSAVMSSVVRRTLGGHGAGKASRHRAAMSEIEMLREHVRKVRAAAAAAAAAPTPAAGTAGSSVPSVATARHPQDRQAREFRSLLRSVLGPVVSRDSRGTVHTQRRHRGRASATVGAAAADAEASNADTDTDSRRRTVPSLASLCLDVLIEYVDCVAEPSVFLGFTGEQQERMMREAGGMHGVELEPFTGMCGPLVHDAVVRGPQGSDAFVEALLPRVVGVTVDVEALAAEVSSDSSDADDSDDGDGGGFAFAPPPMAAWTRRVEGCRRLQSLCLFQAKLVTVHALEQVAQRLPHLQRISIHDSLAMEVGPERVIAALASMSNLRFISITRCSWLHLTATTDLAPLLCLKHLRHLVLHKVTTNDVQHQRAFHDTVTHAMFPRAVRVDVTFKVHFDKLHPPDAADQHSVFA